MFSFLTIRKSIYNLIIVILLGACGGGGGGGDDDAVNLQTNKDIVYVYLNDSSLINVLENDSSTSGTSLTVTGYTQGAKGTVQEVSNGIFSYTPNVGDFGNDVFSYTVTDGKDSLTENAAVVITRWERAAMVNMDSQYNMFDQSLAVDSNGVATFVWVELINKTGDYNLLSRQYSDISGWRPIKIVSTPNTRSSSVPRLLVDSTNKITAVWNHDGNQLADVFTSQYDDVNEVWGTHTQLNSVTQDGLCKKEVIDSNDMITVIWSEGDFSLPETLVAKRFNATTLPVHADLSLPDVYVSSFTCRIEVSQSGLISAIWRQVESGVYSVWFNQYREIGGWGGPTKISETAAFEPDSSVSTYDGLDNLFTAWYNYDKTEVWVSRNDDQLGLGAPVKLNTSSHITNLVGVFADNIGDAVVIWAETGDQSSINYPYAPYNLFASQFKIATGWSTPVMINAIKNSINDVNAYQSGNRVLLATLEGESTSTIVIREYAFDTGWGDPLSISDGLSKNKSYFTPKFASNDNEVMLVWPEKLNPQYRLWATKRDALGVWSKAVPLDSGEIREKQAITSLQDDITDVNLVLDSSGNATVIWTQYECDPADLTGYKCWSLWSARYQAQ